MDDMRCLPLPSLSHSVTIRSTSVKQVCLSPANTFAPRSPIQQQVIVNDQGDCITPWAPIGDDEQLDAAKAAFQTSPLQTVSDMGLLTGCNYDEPGVKHDMKHWPFKIVNKGGRPTIQVENKSTLKDFMSSIFTKMEETAEAYHGNEVTHAIVTIPTYFNDSQCLATKDAGTIAGLTDFHMVNKPTVTAIAYGLNKKGGETQIIVYNLGGGTFNVSLLSINNGVFKVLATAGDTHLGGENIDNHVIKHCIHEYKKKTGTDITKNQHALSKLKEEVEKAKCTLSSQMSTKLEIKSFENGNDFSETLTCSKFEDLNIDLFCKTMKPVKQVLKDASIKKEDISNITMPTKVVNVLYYGIDNVPGT
ncbi:ATPase with role in protein import into the ER [Ceratobasidium sp. 423]|nr:ATPase with role in protein import into the ER [Ceratobasidium sp. 423]